MDPSSLGSKEELMPGMLMVVIIMIMRTMMITIMTSTWTARRD